MIKLSQVSKQVSSTQDSQQSIIHPTDLHIAEGEFVTILGKSGSGKSTLLNLIAGIDVASSGQINIAGQNLAELKPSAMDRWRGRHVGLVFQFFQLMPTLTALENVVLAMDLSGRLKRAERRPRAEKLLAQMDLQDKLRQFPGTLSGGEQQRVAIARALANDPMLILADEPTGNLDSRNAELTYELFSRLNQAGKTVVLVSHDRECTRYSQRSLEMCDGRIKDTEATTNA
ncbi:MAG: ABC transporter ATP-binding protein [Alteromonadaceae bacterium]|nr:MAG: ABC transporter ATP-binding protein [Alteromonadaceae bacterium]